MITINASLSAIRWQGVGGRVLVPGAVDAEEFIVQGLTNLGDKDSVARRLLVRTDHADAAFTYADVVEILGEVTHG